MDSQSIVIYRSPFQRDMYEGFYYLLQTYPYQIVGVLMFFVVLFFVGPTIEVKTRKLRRKISGK